LIFREFAWGIPLVLVYRNGREPFLAEIEYLKLSMHVSLISQCINLCYPRLKMLGQSILHVSISAIQLENSSLDDVYKYQD
jgi:hypothetical protein